MQLWPSALGTSTVVVIYAIIFAAVHVTDQLPNVPEPSDQLELSLAQAWKDLHVIAARPHPYNSHANDLVHAYLISRLEHIVAAYPHVHLVDDRVSNGSYDRTYFEGTNILVKVDGTDPNQHGAVLFSAHYDSVSTSNGATDDGIGIVSMLQMVGRLAHMRTKRTAIFNFNNGEEDGLYGAHSFLQHPWAKLIDTFLNLEGASSGSRPILFRGTSTKPLRAFLHKNVPHPHGTVLAADAFARGIIRSGTDYSVYTDGGGFQGLDLAFYKGRSAYHTKYDSIPFLRGGTSALWSMMEVVNGAGLALLDQDDGELPGAVVYFDLFGRFMVMFSLKTMQTFNVIFLAAVPIIAVILVSLRRFATTDSSHHSLLHRLWHGDGSQDSSWVRFWVALIMAVASQVGLVLAYLALNKYVVYSAPYFVIASAISLVYIVFYLSLTSVSLGNYVGIPKDANAQLLQLVVFSYILLLATTTLLPIGATYLITALATCAFLGWIVGTVDTLKALKKEITSEGRLEAEIEAEVDSEPTEFTPLIERRSPFLTITTPKGNRQCTAVWFTQLFFVAPLPIILVSHIGIILIGAMPEGITDGGPVWLGKLPLFLTLRWRIYQPHFAVYAGLSLISTLLVLPVMPFISSYPPAPPLALAAPFQYINNPKTLFRFLLVLFGLTTAYNSGLLGILLTPTSPPATRFGFPFSIDIPMKVFFQQRVEVVALWAPTQVAADAATGITFRPVTYLIGLPGYLDQMILPSVPSALNNGAACVVDGDRKGLLRCSWSSGIDMIPSPGKPPSDHSEENSNSEFNKYFLSTNTWIRSSISRVSRTSARFWIRGTNTRACRIKMNDVKVANWSVVGGTPGFQKRHTSPSEAKNSDGLTELRFLSRTWDREFVVDVEFVDGLEKIEGSVACEWSEHESGLVGMPQSMSRASIPAYEEVLQFFPRWAALTKLTDGLVEVWSAFEI
ncbi:hypothetical protein H0H81_006612 [Sphagnurus paluster]|uniref:Peptide hydrolase n=1 Tax=Sphagnurus paluster TaxID=117069 RepID=A0A9P7FT87_9AGAR|nr:hypothetical protein H0H81_006612 [Sphagnurus paluster]